MRFCEDSQPRSWGPTYCPWSLEWEGSGIRTRVGTHCEGCMQGIQLTQTAQALGYQQPELSNDWTFKKNFSSSERHWDVNLPLPSMLAYEDFRCPNPPLQRNCADPEGFAPCKAGGAASWLPSQFNVRDGLSPQAELCLPPSWDVFA